MAFNNPKPSFNYVPEYEVSGWPWVTSSAVQGVRRYDFSTVTSHIFLRNNDSSSIRLGWTQLGVQGSNYFLVPASGIFDQDVKCTSVWLSGSGTQFSMFVEVTGIEAQMLPLITGSIDGTGSLNVG